MPAKTSTVPELFAAAAAATPEQIAVVDGTVALTYRQLLARAAGLSHELRAAGLGRGDFVGLRCARGADSIVAMLGILGAGAAYVPLEPSLPDARVRLLAADAGVRTVVAVPPATWTLSDVDVRGLPGGEPADLSFPDAGLEPDDLMYVPYTSGSTGTPKGVEVPHRSIPGFFRGESYGEWGPGRRVLHHSALSWDGHIYEIYPALLSGGTVVVHRGDEGKDPLAVAAAGHQAGAAMLLLPTQAFNTVAAERPELLAGLRCLVIGGEVASPDHLRRVMTAYPDLRILNAYGPVECTCLATLQDITLADLDLPAVPIGPAIGDRDVYLLDGDGQPVPDGAVGEVHIGGPSVGRGYLARPALTADRFVPDPFGRNAGGRLYRTGDLARRHGGVYHFVGRADDQIKLRGFRIELGEIDAVLRTHTDVRDAATVVHDDGSGPRLVSYVVPAGVDPVAIRAYVKERLPEAMVPTAVVAMSSFPTTHSGKLDRRALPAPAPVATLVAPEGPTEQGLAAIWATLLGSSSVGRDDDFFAVGGHSLLAARLVRRVRETFAVRLTVRDVYDRPVLSELASTIEARSRTAGDLGVVAAT